ncbi:calcium-binding protein [Anabaena catenula]|uniref:Calcium-binding protein n=1 Tax=Anabaena catenula FACHB-362 TaxID=2692877 RepID=A0ABR8IZ61_9NOST|nr:calcium-binding protein [Anabaena catenula]MBD2690196.1 calcium-binding protein [Anabaena catenula FACHB-362]
MANFIIYNGYYTVDGVEVANPTNATIIGTGANDVFVTSTPAVTNVKIRAGAGDDILKGTTDGRLDGEAGNDTFDLTATSGVYIGGAGDDFYKVYDFAYTNLSINEIGGGTDTIFSQQNFSLSTGATGVNLNTSSIENLTFDALSAAIVGEGNNLNNQIIGNQQDNILIGLAGADTIFGGSGNDLILGDADNDQLFGNQGNDLLIAGTGTDTLTGGVGNDKYIIDSADTVVELAGEGIDSVDVTVLTAGGTWVTNAEVQFINIGGTNAANVTQNNADGSLILGNSAANTLTGGAGNDTLNGKSGNDTLIGGSGADVFEFGGNALAVNPVTGYLEEIGVTLGLTGTATNTIGKDTITDFVSGIDGIDLDVSTFTAVAGSVGSDLSAVANGFISVNQATNAGIDTQNAFFVYNQGTGDLFYNVNLSAFGSGGGGIFANLGAGTTLVATDVFLIS